LFNLIYFILSIFYLSLCDEQSCSKVYLYSYTTYTVAPSHRCTNDSIYTLASIRCVSALTLLHQTDDPRSSLWSPASGVVIPRPRSPVSWALESRF